jgi:hypothetical protein
MSMGEALVGAAVGLIAGLVPFGYTVAKDKREREERDQADDAKEKADKQRSLESHRERMQAVAVRYIDLLGKTMALLDAIDLEAKNAEQLLASATDAYGDLQGHAHGALRTQFEESSAVIWSDRICRKLLRDGLDLARRYLRDRPTGDTARQIKDSLGRVIMLSTDRGGPRQLFQFSSDEACERWPRPLTSFKELGLEEKAKDWALVIHFKPPP